MIEIKTPNVVEVKLRLGSFYKQSNSIIARSINRAVTTAKKHIGKEVTKNYVIKNADVKDTLSITKANRNRLGALIRSKGHRIPLYKFRVSPKEPRPKNPPKSYKAKVKKSSSLKAITGAFVSQMGSGHKGIFRRTGKKRLPVKELYGPAIPQMIGNKQVMGRIQKEASDTLMKRLDHEIRRAGGR